MIYQERDCSMSDPNPMYFNDKIFSQALISDSLVTCYFKQLENSSLNKMILNNETVNKILFKHKTNFTSDELKIQLPIFQKKLGDKVPLKF